MTFDISRHSKSHCASLKPTLFIISKTPAAVRNDIPLVTEKVYKSKYFSTLLSWPFLFSCFPLWSWESRSFLFRSLYTFLFFPFRVICKTPQIGSFSTKLPLIMPYLHIPVSVDDWRRPCVIFWNCLAMLHSKFWNQHFCCKWFSSTTLVLVDTTFSTFQSSKRL